jgi:hypothetical protein
LVLTFLALTALARSMLDLGCISGWTLNSMKEFFNRVLESGRERRAEGKKLSFEF